jgi:hypothetical protein
MTGIGAHRDFGDEQPREYPRLGERGVSLLVWSLNGPISDGGSQRFTAIKQSLAHSLHYLFFNLGGAPSPVLQYPKWPWPPQVLSIRLSDPPAAK